MRARLRAGDQAAFGELFDEQAQVVYHHGTVTGSTAIEGRGFVDSRAEPGSGPVP